MKGCGLARQYALICVPILKRHGTLSHEYLIKITSPSYVPKNRIHMLSADSINYVSETQMKQCLSKFNINYEDGYTCLMFPCPFCKTQGNLIYVNKISGLSICSTCKKLGNWKSIELSLFKPDEPLAMQDDTIVEDGLKQWVKMSKHLQPLNSVSNDKIVNILSDCKCKGVKVELLEQLDTRVDVKNSEIYVPLWNGQHIVGYKRLSPDGEDTYPSQSARGVISMKRSSKTAVVVHNIKDLFALASKVPDNVVCLPHGEQSLPQEILPLFEDYKKIVLWFGNDAGSWDTVRIFAKKLFEQRCHLVRPLENHPRAEIAVAKNLNVDRIISSAQPVSHASITTFAQLREDVLSELYNIDKVSGVKWLRFRQMNSLLKGHRRGELTILTGPTGSGKTTLMSEYSLDLAIQGVTTLWGSFEIRNQRLAKMMMQQYVREPLETNLPRFNVWADAFQRLPLYFMTFHGQQSLQLVMEAVEHASYVHDIAHVVIDNVQFMLGLSNTETGFLDRFYRQDALIAAFRNFATIRNVHVTLVIHPRKEKEGEQLTANSIFGGAKASQEADNILIIQQRTLQSLKIKKFLQVAKNRYSGDLGVMPLEFDKSSLSFTTKIDS